MLDVAALRDQFRTSYVSAIYLVRSAGNIADSLTKSMQQAALREVMMHSGKIMSKPVHTIVTSQRKE